MKFLLLVAGCTCKDVVRNYDIRNKLSAFLINEKKIKHRDDEHNKPLRPKQA